MEVGERAAQRRADGMTVFAEDEAAVQRSQNPAYGWRPTGGREQVRASFSRESVRIFGAMSQDELRIKIVESTNSEYVPGIPGGDPQGPSAVIHGP